MQSEEDEGMESDMESLLASGSDGEGASPADVRRRVLAAAREAGAAAGRALRALANGTEGNDIGDAPSRGDGSGDDDEFEEVRAVYRCKGNRQEPVGNAWCLLKRSLGC